MSPGPPLSFFSYSRHDSDFVLTLAKDLRAAGADLWLDQLDIRAGQHWDTVIADALGRSTLLLVVLTPDSIASDNVMDEVSFALEKQKKVIPVLHKPCDVPFRLRRMQYADFTLSYEKGLEALLRALEVEPPSAPPPPEAKPPAPPSVAGARAGAAPQTARAPVMIPPPVTTQTRQGLSRGALIAIAIGVVVLAVILFSVFNSPKPDNDVKSNTPYTKPEDNSDAGTKATGNMVAAPPPAPTEVTPPDAAWVNSFLRAAEGPSVNSLRPFYDDTVSPYYGIASAGWSEIAQDKQAYFARFPTINYQLAGLPTYYSASPTSGKIEFVLDYTETRSDGKELAGRSQMSLSVRAVSGWWKITGITERKVH